MMTWRSADADQLGHGSRLRALDGGVTGTGARHDRRRGRQRVSEDQVHAAAIYSALCGRIRRKGRMDAKDQPRSRTGTSPGTAPPGRSQGA